MFKKKKTDIKRDEAFDSFLVEIREGKIESIKEILKKNKKFLNKKTPALGWTALICSAFYNRFDVTIELLKRGADPTIIPIEPSKHDPYYNDRSKETNEAYKQLSQSMSHISEEKLNKQYIKNFKKMKSIKIAMIPLLSTLAMEKSHFEIAKYLLNLASTKDRKKIISAMFDYAMKVESYKTTEKFHELIKLMKIKLVRTKEQEEEKECQDTELKDLPKLKT